MKRLFAVSVLLVVVGCASILGDHTVNVTGAEIQQKLNEKLAIPISLLKVFDVNLSNYLVTFDQATEHMLTVMDADLSSAFLIITYLVNSAFLANYALMRQTARLCWTHLKLSKLISMARVKVQ
ncbi:MAG: hypothetical protein OR997_07140 [Methylophilaceae bacterium]|nr:hypothetical protein [Methylophilaceae bacterium]